MAPDDLYSAAWPLVEAATCSPEIQEAIAELRRFAEGGAVQLRRWNDDWVAACLDLKVDLPARGPVRGVDIRAREPVIVVMHRRNYSAVAPGARSDRKDFPRFELPHLNPVARDQPASLCLHRGSIDQWFASHTMSDFMVRVTSWYRDAARGRLIRADDRFEPTRFEAFDGYFIVDPIRLTRELWRVEDIAGSRFVALDLLSKGKDPSTGDAFTLRYWMSVHDVPAMKKLALLSKELAPHGIDETIFGVLLWGSKDATYSRFLGSVPTSFGELIEFGRELGIDVVSAVRGYFDQGLDTQPALPVVVAVKRPSKLIGSDIDVEFLTFVMIVSADTRSVTAGFKEDTRVYVLGNRLPLVPEVAARLSRVERIERPIVALGAGALGSKVLLHFARAGTTNIEVVDHDTLSPHNLVRHALMARALGRNKAEALTEEMKAIFKDEEVKVSASPVSAIGVIAKGLEDESLVIDTTASPSVLRTLLEATDLRATLVRGELAFDGQLGFLSVEGADRNPRLDDIHAMKLDAALENGVLAAWLTEAKRENETNRAFEEIEVGVGCSSNTLRLADDLISFHAAAIARGVRDLHQTGTGHLQVSEWHIGSGTGRISRIPVDPFVLLPANNDPAWQIRVSESAASAMKTYLKQTRPRETGGLLIGSVDRKRRVIHVTRALPAPPDSQASRAGFYRGIRGTIAALTATLQATGNQLYYAGEWHTHPGGGALPSDTDLKAVNETRAELDRIDVPTHIMIVTPNGLNSYVFGPATRNA